MVSNEVIIDTFERIKEAVHTTTEGLNVADLTFRPTESANSIAWLIWHLTRIQDDHVADLAQKKQLWNQEWYQKFALPFDESETGYGHNSNDIAAVQPDTTLLLGYYDAVHSATIDYIHGLKDDDYAKIVDKNWDPPVTVAVRLVSVISDDLQHAGQAAYVRGLLK